MPIQVFKIASPAWVKYLQLHILSHHGTEAVCALNDIRVYGKSAADDLEDQLAMDSVVPAKSPPPEPSSHAPISQPPALPLEVTLPATATADSDPGSAVDGLKLSSSSVDDAAGSASSPPKPPVAVPGSPAGRAQEASQPASGEAGAMPGAAGPVSTLGAPPAVAPVPQPPQHMQPPEVAFPPPAPPMEAVLGSEGHPTIIATAEPSAGSEEDLVGEGLMLLPGQGSKGKHGGSVYDVLVAELRTLKLQQKALPRSFAALERNVSAAVEALSLALGALAVDVSALQR